MQSSSQYNQSSRPTLPPIRDLFPGECLNSLVADELARRPSLNDSPSMALAKLRVSDEDGNEFPSHSHSMSRPVYRTGYSDPNISSAHRPISHREPHHPQRSDPQYSVLNNRSSSPFLREVPSMGTSPKLFHNGSPRNDGAYETYTHSHHLQPRHRHTVPQPYDYRDSVGLHYPYNNSSATLPRHRSETILSDPPPAPWNISTSIPRGNMIEDDERTPVARFGPDATRTAPPIITPPDDNGSGSAKYECTYCGKGFNRPSSLKIHLNSHTGEKRELKTLLISKGCISDVPRISAFVCPVESCGRSFSVLSNMRRHTRVHATVPFSDAHSNDDIPSSSTASESLSRRWHHRRDSSVSTSSSNSGRSNSISSTEED
ncbi:hypothetical protein CVT25_011037 [Psilocybe cyanescens]|uniref:C2H2-type domain-containing protein n=1 Tax=Psilocybe cyanescens TaxID=93625 RepID=A0A409WFE6_PSICY|nr:hypothetical protein CVT25_011037 [Psilocybe cyanescens]